VLTLPCFLAARREPRTARFEDCVCRFDSLGILGLMVTHLQGDTSAMLDATVLGGPFVAAGEVSTDSRRFVAGTWLVHDGPATRHAASRGSSVLRGICDLVPGAGFEPAPFRRGF
jgi:hypothetical protein